MYVKVINPRTNGRKVYNNRGSSQRCVNYLVAEAKEAGGEATFFGPPGTEPKTAAEAVALLDGNVKGLGSDAPKFHSLVLSPGHDELILMGNNPRALEQYTRQVMGLYAENYNLRNREQLGEANLVWAATIHRERKNRGTDEGVQGEKKDGLQTHVHIMVSARDVDQKITLNPLGRADRFHRVRFMAEAVVEMEMQFGRVVPLDLAVPKPSRQQLVEQTMQEINSKAAANKKEVKPLTPEQVAAKDARLDVLVARANTVLISSQQLDPARVKEVAKERGYDLVFFSSLKRIESTARKGGYTPERYAFLATGRVAGEPKLDEGVAVDPADYLTPMPKPRERPEWSAGMLVLKRRIEEMEQALATRSQTQNVSSTAEKELIKVPVQDREIER